MPENAPLPSSKLSNDSLRAKWGAILAISVSIFVQIGFQVLPIGLLTPIAADLGVSEGAAGHGVSMTGLFGLISSLCIPALARNLNRKTLLLVLTALMAVSGLLTGLAHGFVLYMVSRALLGITVGCFWTMATGVALRLVPEEKAPQALAIFNGGNALAIVVTAPLASYLGEYIGWRSVFLWMVPLAVAVLFWQWWALPSLPPRQRKMGLRPRADFLGMVALLRRRFVMLGLVSIAFFYAGQFALFTYVRPFLETVPQITPERLSLVLLTPGMAGVVGSAVISRVIRAGLYRSLIGAPLLLALVALAFIACHGSLWVVVGLLALWGLVATPAPVGCVAVIQASIALGATFGGLLYDTSGYALTFSVAAGLLLVAGFMAWVTKRATA